MRGGGGSSGDIAQTLGELRHSDALALERLWCPHHRCGVGILNHKYRNFCNILLFHMLFWNIKYPILLCCYGKHAVSWFAEQSISTEVWVRAKELCRPD